MFVTGRAQRHGQRAASQSSRAQNARALGVPEAFQLTEVRKPATKRKRHATIGDDYASGLVIQGSNEPEWKLGENPDDVDPAMAGLSLRNPDFPISYSGLGTLKFASPVRIPTIDGDLHVSGKITQSDQSLFTETKQYNFLPLFSTAATNAGPMTEIPFNPDGANNSVGRVWKTGRLAFMVVNIRYTIGIVPQIPPLDHELFISLANLPAAVAPSSTSTFPQLGNQTVVSLHNDLHLQDASGLPFGRLLFDRIELFERFSDAKKDETNLTVGDNMNYVGNSQVNFQIQLTYVTD